jgi:hypothetical protein
MSNLFQFVLLLIYKKSIIFWNVKLIIKMENNSKLIIFYDEEYIDPTKIDEILSNLEKYNKGIAHQNDRL